MTETLSSKRINYFDNIKFVLVFLVVLGHMVEISNADGFANSVRFFIYTFHMPAFIFVSGLFFNKNNIEKCRSRVLFFLSLYVAIKIVELATRAILFHDTSISVLYINGMPWFLFAMAIWCVLLTVLRNENPVALIMLFVIAALLIGYDDSIGSFLALSRMIVFFPFFILGTITDKGKLIEIARKRIVKIISSVVFVTCFILILAFYSDINWMESMLSGQNPYSTLGKYNEFGLIVRAGSYLMTLVVGTSFILAVPCGKLPISTLGQRSLGVYFWDIVLYEIQVYLAPDLHVWQYFIFAAIVTFLLSTQYVYAPFKKLMKVW